MACECIHSVRLIQYIMLVSRAQEVCCTELCVHTETPQTILHSILTGSNLFHRSIVKRDSVSIFTQAIRDKLMKLFYYWLCGLAKFCEWGEKTWIQTASIRALAPRHIQMPFVCAKQHKMPGESERERQRSAEKCVYLYKTRGKKRTMRLIHKLTEKTS